MSKELQGLGFQGFGFGVLALGKPINSTYSELFGALGCMRFKHTKGFVGPQQALEGFHLKAKGSGDGLGFRVSGFGVST